MNPDKEIDDPEDRKPEDWDEKEKYVRRAMAHTLTYSVRVGPYTRTYMCNCMGRVPDWWNDDTFFFTGRIADPEATKPDDW